MPDLDDEIAVTRWAFALEPGERGRLLLSVANVLAAEDLSGRERSRALLDALVPALAEDAEPSVRREMALRLSTAPWAPPALLEALALDPELDVQAALARAPGLPEPVMTRLAAEGDPPTRLALTRRPELPQAVLDALIEAARRQPALRARLARRPDLSREQALRLRALVGPELAGELAARFELPPAPPPAQDSEAADRLADKLARAGRLTPDYALAQLRRGRTGVFGQTAARLGAIPLPAVETALARAEVGTLALACAAMGLDRAAFPAVLDEMRIPRAQARSAEVHAAFSKSRADASRALNSSFDRRRSRWSGGPARELEA